jgi:hypothetical protein
VTAPATSAPPAPRPGAAVPERRPDRPVPGVTAARLNWWRSRRRRERDRERPLQPVRPDGRSRLPGTAVDTELVEGRDAYDRPFGVVLVPATGHASLTLRLDPRAEGLLTAAAAEPWVADLGVWLALLEHEPQLAGCAVSVLGGPGPAAAPEVTAQLTWRTRGPYGRIDAAALVVELGARLPHVVGDLDRCEVGEAVPLTAAELLGTVVGGYDPARAADPGRSWSDAGPRSTVEAWDRLRHDSATSLTWSLSDVPPDVVLAAGLTRLAAPDAVPGRAGVARTRVTLVHRPAFAEADDPDEAPVDWTGLAGEPLLPRLGAGAPHLTSLVTVSVTDGPDGREGDLDGAVQRVLTGVSPSLRPWLRPLYGSQAAALAAALPTGTLLGTHTSPPTVIREVEP